jgi:hypothetical protein
MNSLSPVREILHPLSLSDIATIRGFRLEGGGGSYTKYFFRKRIQTICSELKDVFHLHNLFGNQKDKEKELTNQILEIIIKNEDYFFSQTLKKSESLKEITRFIVPLVISLITSSTLFSFISATFSPALLETFIIYLIVLGTISMTFIGLFIAYICENFINQSRWYRRLIYLTKINISEDNIRFIIKQIDKGVFDEIFSLSKYETS